jgi:hypothetical protein
MAVLVPIEKLEPWKFNKPQIILMTKSGDEFIEVEFVNSGNRIDILGVAMKLPREYRSIRCYRRDEIDREYYPVYLDKEALKWIGYFVSALGIPKKLEVNNGH